MPTNIAILNQKGWVGKTTTVTMAAGFAQPGHNVLLVDLDTQGNVATVLAYPKVTTCVACSPQTYDSLWIRSSPNQGWSAWK